ncbi:hypothetical protein TRFO_20576 [Tritrichomonas foetus]|uniref:Uncharacterized protein n=1 Tax=Tritrichomonas foetus TaxID=1144522 RepID=A0A1J4KKH9_9EUKA|nr:hypothetical protein TRFO_20576 [Tritrichomonas foetus]|eukprot:OHT10198.1 hypothetical protein TRFO_20576 [Tritrichomonas foetus]
MFAWLLITTLCQNFDFDIKTHFDGRQAVDKDDTVTITMPAKSMIFLSSLNGFTAKAFKTSGEEIGDMATSEMDRLAFFYNGGKVVVTSTSDANFEFTFHTLVFTVLNGFSESTKSVIISSNPYEYFTSSSTSYASKVTFNNYSLSITSALWLVTPGKEKIKRRVENIEPLTNPLKIYSTSTTHDDDTLISTESVPSFNAFNIESMSTLYTLQGDTRYTGYVSITPTDNVYDTTGYLDDFRILFNYQEANDDFIVKRGKDASNYITIPNLPYGYSKLDFSVNYGYTVTRAAQIIVLCPYENMININSNPSYGVYNYVDKLNIHPDVVDRSNPEQGEILRELLVIDTSTDQVAKYVVSTRTDEVFTVKSDNTGNFTNTAGIRYIMASLAGVQTTVTYTGTVTFKEMHLAEEKIVNVASGSKITGPFAAVISAGATASFTTEIIDPALEIPSYLKNDFTSSISPSKSLQNIEQGGTYVTQKVEEYFTFDMTGISMIKLELYAASYIHNPEGWEGEIEPNNDVTLTDEERKIGPGRNAWVYYNQYGNTHHAIIRVNSSMTNFKLIVTSMKLLDRWNKFIMTNQFKTFRFMPSEGEGIIPIGRYQYVSLLNTNQEITYKEELNNFQFEIYNYEGNTITPETGIITVNNQVTGNVNKVHRPAIQSFYATTSEDYSADITFYKADGYEYGLAEGETQYYAELDKPQSYGFYMLTNQVSGDVDGNNPGTPSDSELNKRLNTVSVDMSSTQTYSLSCTQKTMVILHNKNGFTAKAKDSSGKYFAQITASDKNGVIEFGGSEGTVEFTKTTSASILSNNYFTSLKNKVKQILPKRITSNIPSLFASDSDLLLFSYLKFDNVSVGAYGSETCSQIVVITDIDSLYRVQNTQNSNNGKTANMTIGSQDYCIWYPLQADAVLVQNHHILHSLYIYSPDSVTFENENPALTRGKSFYLWGRDRYLSDNQGRSSSYETSPTNSSFDSSKYAQFNEGIKKPVENALIGGQNEIEGGDGGGDDGGDGGDDPDGPDIVVIIVIVAIVVVVIIIIIVIVVCCIKKKKAKIEASNEVQP